MLRKTLNIDGGGRDNDLQVRPLWQYPLDIPQQKVDVQTSLMGFINNERVVLLKKPVTLGLCEQNAVGHHLDKRRVAGLITEANLKTNGISKGDA